MKATGEWGKWGGELAEKCFKQIQETQLNTIVMQSKHSQNTSHQEKVRQTRGILTTSDAQNWTWKTQSSWYGRLSTLVEQHPPKYKRYIFQSIFYAQ